MYKENINIEDLEIPSVFSNSKPSQNKVTAKKEYYYKYKKFPKLIVRADNLRLLDGYTSYVAAKELNIKSVDCTMLTSIEAIHYYTNMNKKTEASKKIRLQREKGKICYICERQLYDRSNPLYDGTNEFTIDHKIPLFKGGTHTIENLFPCCNICNGLKGDFSYSDELKELILNELKERKLI